MSRYSNHTLSRFFLYILLWIISVVLLGLTAYRIHVTESRLAGMYDPIVVELLVTAILTIIWAPFAIIVLLGDRFANSFRYPRAHHDLGGVTILWILWLVGAAVFTNRILPGKNWCFSQGKQCSVLTAILAMSWTGFGLLTILIILSLMNNAAIRGAVTSEKRGRV